MKDNLFIMLMNFFDRNFSKTGKEARAQVQGLAYLLDGVSDNIPIWYRKPQQDMSTRVLIAEERQKLSSESYRLLLQLHHGGIVDADTLEKVLHQLMISPSDVVSLSETKWAIHNVLAPSLLPSQLQFLDLVLYQKEHAISSH